MSAVGGQYAVKRIKFLSKTKSIICQNENGPCPLLAIMNVLLLLGKADIHRDVTHVDDAWLLSHCAEVLLANAADYQSGDASDGDKSHVQHLVEEAMDLLPRLTEGLDVNVKFDSCESFELSKEIGIFDLVDVRLLHAWLPPDETTGHALSGLSYNQIAEKIVIATGTPVRPMRPSPSPSQESKSEWRRSISGHRSLASGSSVEAGSNAVVTADSVDAHADGAVDDAIDGGPVASAGRDRSHTESSHASPIKRLLSVSSPVHAADASSSEHGDGPSIAVLGASAAEAAGASNAAGTGMSASSPVKADSGEVDVRSALIMRQFLEETASQLTHTGLARLACTLRDFELAVFFRNNHFNTIFNNSGRLYLLVTDLGYADVPSVVWELLDNVHGDTEYCTSEFQPTAPIIEQVNGTAVVGGAAAMPSGDQDADADYVLALQLQEQEREGADAGAASNHSYDSDDDGPPPRQQLASSNANAASTSSMLGSLGTMFGMHASNASGPSTPGRSVQQQQQQQQPLLDHAADNDGVDAADSGIPGVELPDDFQNMTTEEQEMMMLALAASTKDVHAPAVADTHGSYQAPTDVLQSMDARAPSPTLPPIVPGRNDRYKQQATQLQTLAAERERRTANRQPAPVPSNGSGSSDGSSGSGTPRSKSGAAGGKSDCCLM